MIVVYLKRIAHCQEKKDRRNQQYTLYMHTILYCIETDKQPVKMEAFRNKMPKERIYMALSICVLTGCTDAREENKTLGNEREDEEEGENR